MTYSSAYARPAPAGENAGCGPPSPSGGRGREFLLAGLKYSESKKRKLAFGSDWAGKLVKGKRQLRGRTPRRLRRRD